MHKVKDHICWALTAAVLLLAVRSTYGQNMLANPSFEQVELRGDAPVPANWDLWAYGGTALQRVEGVAHSGTGSGRIEVISDGANEFPLFCQRFPVQPGERYRARIWARTEDVASSWGPQLNFEFFDAAGQRLPYVEGGQAGGGTHDWVELTLEAYVPPNAVQLMFSAFSHGLGKVWFDDAELCKVSGRDAFMGSEATVQIRPECVLNGNFLGFGCHGDDLLFADFNTSRGVTSADRQLVRTRVAAIRPKIMRLLFDYKWWEPVPGQHGVDNPFLEGIVDWIRFLQSIHCDVIIHPWGDYFAYSDWMKPQADPHWWTNADSRLPIPSQREAMVRSLADFLRYLRRDQQLTNVRYVALMNEPENDYRRPTPADEYIRLNHLLSQSLTERGLGEELSLLGPDDCTGQSSGRSLWWSQTVPQAIDVFDGFSSHTYKHRDTRMLEKWIGDRLEHARQLDPAGPLRPLLVTEFGYVGLTGETFDNPENMAYEYGLFMGDFAIAILNSRASAALTWCLFDQYYDNTHCQHYGLWEFKDHDWQPRPAYYSWSLVNRYTAANSRIVAVHVTPACESLRAAALFSPAGRQTIMLVNRYDRELQVTLYTGQPRPVSLQVYRYTQDALRTATGQMFRASAELRVAANGSTSLAMPGQSFALLTEFADDELDGGAHSSFSKSSAYPGGNGSSNSGSVTDSLSCGASVAGGGSAE